MRSAKVWTLTIAALAAWPTPRAKATAQEQRETDQQLVWDSFLRESRDPDRYRLSDRDVIRAQVIHSFWVGTSDMAVDWAVSGHSFPGATHEVPRDKVEVVLVSSQNVTWWKGITAFKNAPLRRPGAPKENWVRIGHVDTQDDDHGPDSMLLNVADLRDGLMLSFEKAKAFGAHTPMYSFKVPNTSKLGGHRLIFTWERDG